MDTSTASPPAADAMSTTSVADNERLKRKRQPRNSACQGCAALKMKCIAGANNRCERCNRMDRSCIPAVPKPRKRRTQSNVGLDSSRSLPLSDILASSAPSSAPPPLPKFERPPPLLSKRTEHHNGTVRPNVVEHDSRTFVPLLVKGLGGFATCEDLLRGVNHDFVQDAFATFQHLSAFFPFVEIPASADLLSWITHRPMLTLAVCIVTTADHGELRSRLSQAFRHALYWKLVVGGERSMDLLAGLLVYLAWHHHYIPRQQVYQELCMLASMATDLDLYRTPARLDAWDAASALERDRAFIGCYYLSCSLSRVGYDKPNPLRWTDNLRRCAEHVLRAGKLPSDRRMVATVELVHVLDDAEDAMRFDISAKLPAASYPLAVDLNAKSALHRIKALMREHPPLGGPSSFAASSIHLYSRMMRSGEPPDSSTLIQCACAIKEYLDDLLARPAATLHQLAIVDWIQLLEILLLMAHITRLPLPGSSSGTGSSAHGRGDVDHHHQHHPWPAAAALTSVLQPDALLDALYAHMAAAPAGDRRALRDDALLRWFGAFCDGIKQRILHAADVRPQGAGLSSSSRPGDVARQPESLGGHADIFRYLNDGVLDENFLRYLTNM